MTNKPFFLLLQPFPLVLLHDALAVAALHRLAACQLGLGLRTPAGLWGLFVLLLGTHILQVEQNEQQNASSSDKNSN